MLKLGDRVRVSRKDGNFLKDTIGDLSDTGTIVIVDDCQYAIHFDNEKNNIPQQTYRNTNSYKDKIEFDGGCYFFNTGKCNIEKKIRNTELARKFYPKKTVSDCGEYLI